MRDLHEDDTRVGWILNGHKEELRSLPAAVGAAAGMLREVLIELEVSGEYPKTWSHGRVDAVLALIEGAADRLYETIVVAIGEGDE